MRKSLLILTLIVLAAMSAYHHGIRLNLSHSYPPGVYVITPQISPIALHQLILFCPPNNEALILAKERGYIQAGWCSAGTVPMMKRIIAMPGDDVSFTHVVTINGQPLDDAHRDLTDSKQRPLPQLSPFIVPESSVFVYSEHAPETSFDSRYFGPVPMANIIGQIAPLILFP